jgi:polypeptide N-acetylgalactosaminyltransferase
MCGGRIIIHPCSHVAHVFRKETPYKFLDDESIFVTIFKNYKRVALVWLDEYKQLIYAVNPDIKRLNGGDVSDRLQLRQRLNCSSFKDYLQMFHLKNFPFNHRFIGSVCLLFYLQLNLFSLFFYLDFNIKSSLFRFYDGSGYFQRY